MSSRQATKARAREARLAAERKEQESAALRRRLATFAAILVVAAVVVLAAVLLSPSGSDDAGDRRANGDVFAGVTQDGAWLGRSDAPVTVEEYVDPQCPFCARFSTDQLPAIVRDHVRPGQVRMRMRLLTFLGPDSREAASAIAAASPQNREWDLAERLFAEQGSENSGYVTPSFLRDQAASVSGLDVDRLSGNQTAPDVAGRLRDDARAAQRAGVEGTPAFVVRPKGDEAKVVNADELPAAIEAALGGA